MPFEILHFRKAEEILKAKNMETEIRLSMDYLEYVLYGTFYRRELLRQALEEMEWRNREDLNILEGRRYNYKGFRNRVAMDGNFSSYEYIQDALLRLQIGFDKGKIDMGIVLVTAERSQKSPLGSTKELVCQEIEMLYPTISLPVTIVLFDLGKRGLFAESQSQIEEKVQGEAQPVNEIINQDGSQTSESIEENNDRTSSPDSVSSEIPIPNQKKQRKKRKQGPINDLTHEPIGVAGIAVNQ